MTWPTIEELSAYQRTAITSADDIATATQALELAKSAVQAEVGSPIERTSVTQTFYPPDRQEFIVLPSFPVTEVESVTEDGTLLVVDDDYSWSEAGLILRIDAYWTKPVTVEYAYGFTEIPGYVRAVVMSIASRAFQQTAMAGSIQSETIGSYSVTYGSSTSQENAGLIWENEKRMLDPLRSSSVV